MVDHLVHMTETTMVTVQSVHMAVKHQVDGSITAAFISTSTTTTEDHKGLSHLIEAHGIYHYSSKWKYVLWTVKFNDFKVACKIIYVEYFFFNYEDVLIVYNLKLTLLMF